MMVKLIVPYEWKGVLLTKGTLLDLPHEDSRKLIADRIAVPFVPSPTVTVVSPGETR